MDKDSQLNSINAAYTQDKQVKTIQENENYKNLQKELAAKKNQGKKIDASQFQDKIEIRNIFNWKRSKEGDFFIKAEGRVGLPSVKDPRFSGSKIRRALGVDIDFESRLNDLKEDLGKMYVETRSHNYLMAKWAEVKYGFIAKLLSIMGVSPQEMRQIQRLAIAQSKSEAEILMEQNLYNEEMLNLFSGEDKKDRKPRMIFAEVTKQLKLKMKALSKEDYYTPEKMTQLRIKQVEKIRLDLVNEMENLKYLKDFTC